MTNNHPLFPVPSTQVIPKTALITEGGGQRGIFTAGVLDYWLEAQFNPFEILIGTSAGAQNLSSYITGQKGYAQKSIFTLSRDQHFFSLKHTFIGTHTVDLDWYFEQISRPEFTLNFNHAKQELKKRTLLFATTRIPDFKACYFSPQEDNWLTLLKASSALPFLYRKGVEISGEYYVDGGVSAPIPVEKAFELGATTIVVIRTVPHGHHSQSPFIHQVKHWLNSHKHSKPIDYFLHHETCYDEALAFIDTPPKNVKIIEIFPKKPLNSKLIGSKEKELQYDYELGRLTAADFLRHNACPYPIAKPA